MQKRAPTLANILVIVLFALSCFGLLLFLWESFGGPVPLKPEGYRFTVNLSRTLSLAEESDVRISGVEVGHIVSLKLNNEGHTQATVEIAARYAPTVLASFGPASARVSVRVIAPKGPAAYKDALAADQKISKTVGTGLVTSSQITETPAAKAAMTGGRVDSRALIVITALASEHPIDILSFGGTYAGTSADAPLRVVDLAETDAAAHLGQSAYVRSMIELLRVQPATYRPLRVSTVSLAGGQKALQVEFAAPSPVGLLNPPQ